MRGTRCSTNKNRVESILRHLRRVKLLDGNIEPGVVPKCLVHLRKCSSTNLGAHTLERDWRERHRRVLVALKRQNRLRKQKCQKEFSQGRCSVPVLLQGVWEDVPLLQRPVERECWTETSFHCPMWLRETEKRVLSVFNKNAVTVRDCQKKQSLPQDSFSFPSFFLPLVFFTDLF